MTKAIIEISNAERFFKEVAEYRALKDKVELLRQALDFIASDATIVPDGCPEPWRSTIIEWVNAANHALSYTK